MGEGEENRDAGWGDRYQNQVWEGTIICMGRGGSKVP